MADTQTPRMGESEKKGDMIFNVILTVLAAVSLLVAFVFNTQVTPHVKAAGWGWHVLAIIMILASVAVIWKMDKVIPAFMSKIPPKGLAFVLIFLAPVVAAGFKLGQ